MLIKVIGLDGEGEKVVDFGGHSKKLITVDLLAKHQ